MFPVIKKCLRIIGKTLSFRNASITDAEFIFSLRADQNKARFLTAVPPQIEAQRSWLAQYSEKKDQAYFIIYHESTMIGTVRLYDAKGESFCWGSWILTAECPSHAAIESALMVYSYGIDHLKFSSAHFDVRKGNERVWKFHERFGAQCVTETETDFFYTISAQAISLSRRRYSRYLPNDVIVE